MALYTFAADGTAPFAVTNIVENLEREEAAHYWVPIVSWSPAGYEILYSCGGVCVVNIDGRQVIDGRRVPRDLRHIAAAAWSPDGSRIAVSPGGPRSDEPVLFDGRDDRIVLYTMDSDGTDINILVKRDGANGGRLLPSKP